MKRLIPVSRTLVSLLILIGVMPVWNGCSSLFSWGKKPPRAVLKSDVFATNASNRIVTMGVLQMKVMRFADKYVSVVAQGADDMAAEVGTPEARLACMRWKTGQATAAYTIATGENPVINALDMLVLVTVSRMVVETTGTEKFGTNVMPLVAIQARLETSAWELASGALKPAQKIELSNLIEAWRKRNPRQRYIGSVRFVEFAQAAGHGSISASAPPNSIFSLLFIDPFAGLDPTTVAIEAAQQFGERMMYYGQRLPQLLTWQAELAAMEMAGQPESRQLLTNAQQLASAAETFSQVAAQLPQVLNAQREAAIDQVFDRLRSEGTNSRAMLIELRSALDSGEAAAKSINTAIQSLDEFVRYVSKPGTNPPSGSTNTHPYNVLDYGIVAVQISQAAKELNAALTTLNQTAPELEKITQQATANADRLATRFLVWGLIVIGIMILGGGIFAGLVLRTVARRNGGDGKKAG